ncbi:MAG: ribonuclease III [Ruminococcaceae bacterium]|nr:ribonuclease III [Oscillospiraceae bacterium]
MLDINYNGVTLAYIGDAVIELAVREVLISSGITDTGRLSSAAQKLVCAPTQSAVVEKLLPLLTEEEAAAYKLGRNHRISGKPKHASVSEYSRATGLEAIFGYLHLTGQTERIQNLILTAYEELFVDIKSKI